MKDLRTYKENGYNYNYIVVVIDAQGILQDEVFKTRKQAENSKIAEHGEVLTFRQAAKEYPDHYKF